MQGQERETAHTSIYMTVHTYNRGSTQTSLLLMDKVS